MLPALEFPLIFLLFDSICFALDTVKEKPLLLVAYTVAGVMYKKDEVTINHLMNVLWS